MNPTERRIHGVCKRLARFLVRKHRSYGESALKPLRVFARGRAEELLAVRLDDKLSRIRNAPDAFGEDAVWDLLGYLVLLVLARKDRRRKRTAKRK